MWGHLNKSEALAVLHEIVDTLGESVIISCVSLDSNVSQVSKDAVKVGYLIRIKCDLDNYTRNCLNPLLEKHGLTLKEEKGYIIISPC
jgi:hypothetical protein